MDYEQLLDPDSLEFLNWLSSRGPDDVTALSPFEQRAVFEAVLGALQQPRPEGIVAEDMRAGDVPVRVFSAGLPTRTVVYFHGGGFVMGSLDSHDDLCAEFCAQTGYRVVSVAYRLAPEHRHPAAYEDSLTATRWALETFEAPVVLVGDSAGGALSAAVAKTLLSETDQVLGQVLIYPLLGGEPDQGSFLEHAQAPMLTTAQVRYYLGIRHGDFGPREDPTSDPLTGDDFAGLPPVVVFTADIDPLRDDGSAYVQKIVDAGGTAHWVNEEKLVHGYLCGRHRIARAASSFERITIAIEALGQEIWPYD